MEALAVIIAILGCGYSVFLAGKSRGKANADTDRAKEYREARKDVDNADLGLGATDDERVKRLRQIANGR